MAFRIKNSGFFEGLEQLDENARIVIGVGTKMGPSGIVKAEDIYEDSVFDNRHFNPRAVVEEYLPELLKSNSGGLPMYKYLALYEGEKYGKVKENIIKHQGVDDFLNQQLRLHKMSYHRELSNISVQTILAKEGFEYAYKKMCFLEETEIDLDQMSKYIRELLKAKGVSYLKNNSELKRLIRIYDWMKYNSTVQ